MKSVVWKANSWHDRAMLRENEKAELKRGRPAERRLRNRSKLAKEADKLRSAFNNERTKKEEVEIG